MTENLGYFVAKVIARPLKTRTQHYRGLPPQLATDVGSRTEMPVASALLIEIQSEGVFLYRVSADGQFAGDTWHESLGAAKDQAEFEFGSGLSDWTSIPTDVEDAMAYVRKLAAPDAV